jgi:single-stranded DNA-binding protein
MVKQNESTPEGERIGYGDIASETIKGGVGDSIIAIGKLSQREYEKDGVKHSIMQFRAESVGVSVKFGPAKTKRMLESSNTTAAIESLQATEMPF